MENGGIGPLDLTLDTRRRWVVSFIPLCPIYTLEESTRCPVNRRLSGPQSVGLDALKRKDDLPVSGIKLSSPLPRAKNILARNKLPYCKHLMNNLLPQKIDLRHLARTIICVCICVCVCVCVRERERDVFTQF
jgi:hypothetical protein